MRNEGTMKLILATICALSLSAIARAELTVDIEREGVERIPVSIEVSGNQAFAKSLRRNLELSGVFQIRANASVKVKGATGGAIAAEGRGKRLAFTSKAADERSARMEARSLADRMMQTYAGAKPFATNPIAFVERRKGGAEIYTCFPDGYDMRRLTSDGREAVGPRWKDRNTLFYTGFLSGGPKVYELDTRTGSRNVKWGFKGLTTGATVSPDGRRVAIILSMHGNPELYVIDMSAGTWTRLTTTKNASEGQPCWSPDGREIVYVSDESRYPQLYVIDVASKKKRRLTSKGSQNVDPDWGLDGRITYITKRGGASQVAVIDPKAGEGSSRLVTKPGTWEHPSWSSDARHVVASRDGALFIVDTDDKGDEPSRLFMNGGNWITPSWSK